MTEHGKQIIGCISGATATILNTILLPFILANSSSNIGNYKFLLFTYTFTAVVYCICQLLTIPTFFLGNDGYLFHQTVLHLSRIPGTAAIFIFILCFLQNLIVLACSFMYRCGVMCSPALMSLFNEPRKLRNLLIAWFLIMIITMISVIYGVFPCEDTDEIFALPIYKALKTNITNIGYVGAQIYNSDGLRMRPAFPVGVYFVAIVVGTTIITTCIAKIQKEFMKNSSQLSSTTQMYHKKLFYLLILQTTFPIIFNFTPPLIAFIMLFLRIDDRDFTQYFGIVMSFAQVVDPLLMFIFIRDYRRAFRRVICRQRISGYSETGTIDASRTFNK